MERPADVFTVEIRERAAPRASVRRMLTGPLGRSGARWEVVVCDRVTGEVVAALTADGTAAEARGLGHVVRSDLEALDMQEFLRAYVRGNRSRR